MVSCHFFSSGSRNHSSLFLHTWTSDTSSQSAALRLLNWEEEKGKERWTKVLASKSLRTLEGVEEEEEEVNEEDEEGDDDKKEERMLGPTA